MPRTAMVVLMFGLTLATTAAANPVSSDELYIDFDPPNRLHSITPTPYTTVDAYVVAEFLDQGWPDGFSAVSFRLSNPLIECPGVMATAVFTFGAVSSPAGRGRFDHPADAVELWISSDLRSPLLISGHFISPEKALQNLTSLKIINFHIHNNR